MSISARVFVNVDLNARLWNTCSQGSVKAPCPRRRRSCRLRVIDSLLASETARGTVSSATEITVSLSQCVTVNLWGDRRKERRASRVRRETNDARRREAEKYKLVKSTRGCVSRQDAPLISRYWLPEISLNVNLSSPLPRCWRSAFFLSGFLSFGLCMGDVVTRDSVRLGILSSKESLVFLGTIGRPRLRLANSNVFPRVCGDIA